MSNYLNPSSAFVILLVGFGLFTGGTVFMGSAFEKHNVDQSQNLTVDKQYNNLQDQTKQLDQRISTVTSDQGSIVDTASAGILIVPDTLSLLTQRVAVHESQWNCELCGFGACSCACVLFGELVAECSVPGEVVVDGLHHVSMPDIHVIRLIRCFENWRCGGNTLELERLGRETGAAAVLLVVVLFGAGR
jgi:hypothetical protein